MDIQAKVPVLGYLSGAPRVSTHPEAEASGPRTHVLSIIGGFRSLDWIVQPFIAGDLLPSRWSGEGSESFTSSGGLRTLVADALRILMGVLNSRLAWKRLGNRVDWVYERYATFQSLGRTFQKNNIPWILETNALYYREASSNRKSVILTNLEKKLEINAYRNCDVLVCVSDTIRNQIIKDAKISENKICVIPNGVDTDLFDPELFKPKRLFKGFTIGFVGHLYPWQGIDLLLSAVSNLIHEEFDIHITIVGDGQIRTKLEKQAAKLGLSSRVQFTGKVPWEEVPQYIAGFDIGYSNKILINNQKPYFSPLKLYEYMAMAKPVLCSLDEQTQSIINDGITGFTFDSDSLTELEYSIKKSYNRQSELELMGQKARLEAVSKHSWEKRVKTIIYETRKILNRSPLHLN